MQWQFFEVLLKSHEETSVMGKKEILKAHTVGTSSFELLAVGTGIQDYPCSDLDDHIKAGAVQSGA